MKRMLVAVACLVVLLPVHAAATGLVLSTGEDQSNHRSAYLNALLTECFRRMGIEITIQTEPHQ